MSQLQRAQRERRKQLRIISKLATQGETCSTARARLDLSIRRFCKDTQVKFCTIHERVAFQDDVSPEESMQEAQLLDLFAPSLEPVSWYPKRKRKGGARNICDLPPEQITRHRMAKRLVEAQLTPNSMFYGTAGRGCSHLAGDLATALERQGPWVLLADIRDCFPSVNIDAVYDLQLLPPEVTRYALDYRSLQFQPPTRKSSTHQEGDAASIEDDNDPVGPRGLLQGSPTSNALLIALLRGIDIHVSPVTPLFVVSDNIAAVGTEGECSQIGERLASHLARCPAGPLYLNWEVANAREGFDHLGYQFTMDRSNRVTVDVSDANFGKLLLRLYSEIENWDVRRRTAAQARSFVREQMTPFPAVTADTEARLAAELLNELSLTAPGEWVELAVS